ncbi:MAG: hypothetical protein WD398_14390 [Cyclobacteriaceae bacterium]
MMVIKFSNILQAMEDYKQIKTLCQKNSDATFKILDEFLLYYAAEKDKLGKEADRRLGTYRHITQKLDKSWYNLLKSQFIIHKVMKKDGLVHKYLNHVALQNRDPSQKEWLEEQSATPWRFSFAIIDEKVAEDFYRMLDVFTGENYLLYSTSMSDTLKEGPRELWFNLIGFNGSCWQTYGPLAGYRSFGPDDIFFFATELNPSIADDEDLMADVERNPVPYMMLFSGSDLPLTVHEAHPLVIALSELEGVSLEAKNLEKDFNHDYLNGVHKLSLKGWELQPHFSVAYYDETDHILQITALTEMGYLKLVEVLNTYEMDLDEVPDIQVKPSMLNTTGDILKRKIELMPYELLFESQQDPASEAELEKINHLMELALPDINAGKMPDIDGLAKKVGLDSETTREILEQVMGKLK